MPASQLDTALSNGHDGHVHPAPPVSGKKAKGKKAIDSTEASRLLQARISQLEQDAAGEKDQELEIGKSALINTVVQVSAPSRNSVLLEELSQVDGTSALTRSTFV